MSDREVAKSIISEIIATAGGTLRGKVRLYKAFYAAHLLYWEEFQGALSGYPIVRMPAGPGIDDGEVLLSEMEDEGLISISKRQAGPYPEYVLTLKRKPKIRERSHRHIAIVKAVKWALSKGARQLSDDSHVISRSWQASQDGDELHIYRDLIENPDEIKAARADISRVKALFGRQEARSR